MGSDNRRLPVQFLAAVAALAETGSPAATFAAAQAQGMTDGLDQERLLSGLLSGPFKDCAPAWMLQIAIEQGLKSSETYRAGMAIDLAALALSHPDSAGELRSAAVRSCTNVQLANLGLAERPDVLVEAVAAELHWRSAPPEPMTVRLLEVPTPAQVVMRTEGLADVMFEAAFKLLPRRPEPTQAGDRGPSQRFFDELDAWEAMWEDILKTHPERHAAIVDHVAEQPASGPIRHCLIGKLPWMVEPELLKSLALEHLDRFQTVLLITQACRMLRSGDSKSAVRDSIASDLEALAPSDRRRVEGFLEDTGPDVTRECQMATEWVATTASRTWRLLLNPSEVPPRYGRPQQWRTSEEDLIALGRAFAEATVSALATWEPDPNRPMTNSSELTWVADILTRLPDIPGTVKAAARLIVTDARARIQVASWRSRLPQQEHRELDRLIATITQLIADPGPDAATRAAALGDPDSVAFRALASVPGDVLTAFLDLHDDNDALVEKALLAVVSQSYGKRAVFSEILARHSNPEHAIRNMTYHLRRRLGGSPPAREAWVREILALPGCDVDLIRALPAWTALAISGNYRDILHAEIVSVVADGLGQDAAAWQRLSDSPISEHGPTAWLRLGEVLDAARAGSEWPIPPDR